MTAQEQLELAKRHLAKVKNAWPEPVDWSDLFLYGFYCLENAVCAAATKADISFKRTHRGKLSAATELSHDHGLPSISELLAVLNDARKAAAYGDVASPCLDSARVARVIEAYVISVEDFIAD